MKQPDGSKKVARYKVLELLGAATFKLFTGLVQEYLTLLFLKNHLFKLHSRCHDSLKERFGGNKNTWKLKNNCRCHDDQMLSLQVGIILACH